MQGGQDKGFCFHYDELSFRRKFLRTIWAAALFVPLGAATLWVIEIDRWYIISWIAVFGTWGAAQAIGNYRNWRLETRNAASK